MKRDKLLRSKEYWLVQIQNDLFGVIENFMKKKKLNRTNLAEKLDVSKGYISQVMNGNFDHKISKLVELSLVCDKVPIISFIDLEKYIKDDAEDNPHHLDNRHIPKNIIYNFYVYNSINSVTSEQKNFDKKENQLV